MSKDKNNGFVSQLFSGDICAVKAQNSAFHSFAQYSQYILLFFPVCIK